MNTTNTTIVDENCFSNFDIAYTVCEVLVSVFAVVGNALVIIVFRKERRLRRRTNYYIVSLAVADFLVGLLGIPFAIMSSIGLPRSLYPCLFTVSLLIVLCTISIFCLVAVSVDRYWAILHPMGYSRNVRTKTALVIISICWLAGTFIGFLPLMGWHKKPSGKKKMCCFFLDVMDYNYLVFLYIGTIITPAIILVAFYAHIYRVVVKQLRQIVTMNPENGTTVKGRTSGGTMLRMLGAAQQGEVKATQNLSIIVLFFMICWVPLYTINCIFAFCEKCQHDLNEKFVLSCIILSHANSAGNPILYAYHLKDFRAALKNFLLSLVGYAPPPHGSLHWRASIVSNTAFNNFSTNRGQSLRESRSALILSPNSKFEAQMFKRESSQSINLPPPAALSSMYAAKFPQNYKEGRDIWRISEVGSTSEEASKDKEVSYHECASLKQMLPTVDVSSSSESETVNSSHGESQNGYEEGSDNVFLDGSLPFIEDSDIEPGLSDAKNGSSDNSVISKIMKKRTILSISSPQLSRNVFLIEPNACDIKPKRAFSRSTSYTGTEDIQTNRKSPIKCALKAVNELLLEPTKHSRSVSLSDDDSLSPKCSQVHRNGTIYTFINNSFEC